MASGWVGGQREKACLGCISETLSYNMLTLGRNISWEGCRCAKSWCDFDLTFNPAVVTLSLKKNLVLAISQKM